MKLINEIIKACDDVVAEGEITRSQLVFDIAATAALTIAFIGVLCRFMYWG